MEIRKSLYNKIEDVFGKDCVLNRDVKDISKDVVDYIKNNASKAGKFLLYTIPAAAMLFLNSCTLRGPTMPTEDYIQYNEVFSNNGETLEVKVNDEAVTKIEYKRPCDTNWTTVNGNQFTAPMQEGCYGYAKVRVYRKNVLVSEFDVPIWMGEADSDNALEQAIIESGIDPNTTEIGKIMGYILNPDWAQDLVSNEDNFDGIIWFWSIYGGSYALFDIQGSKTEVYSETRKQHVHDSLSGYAYHLKVMKKDDILYWLNEIKPKNYDDDGFISP